MATIDSIRERTVFAVERIRKSLNVRMPVVNQSTPNLAEFRLAKYLETIADATEAREPVTAGAGGESEGAH